jgi:hypothetical protein
VFATAALRGGVSTLISRTGCLIPIDRFRDRNKDLYEEVANMKRFTTAQIEKLLIPELEKAQYRRLELHAPQTTMGMFAIGFTIEDVADREAYDSRMALQKVLSTALAGTNWRITTEGASYQLGVLSGRLRGFEGEKELVELAQSRERKRSKKSQKNKTTRRRTADAA